MSETLILSIHPGDTFELIPNMTIPLRATQEVAWSVDGQPHDTATESGFTPENNGSYEIMATTQNGQREIVTIEIIQP
jgi:membrane carboxypeptidase/penicillin-binding protein PbpC